MFGICNLSVIPVRKEPSEKSEQTSQLLFGETVEILDKQDSWRKIRIVHDDYSGWVDKKQLVSLTDDDYKKISGGSSFVSSDLVQIAIWEKNHICPLLLGSSLPAYNNKTFSINNTEYIFEGNVLEVTKPQTNRLIENAYMYLNAPYLWGGRSPFGIDCSGFTQMIYKLCGLSLKRDAWQQAEQGTVIHLLEESMPGDLAFFDNKEGKITHVGMILNSSHIIHSSGRVRIDKLDHQGIFNEETKTYSHNLRIIKRMI